MTADNEEAEIVVAENLPFITSTATSDQNLSNTFNQVDREDVGITLRITPQISSGDGVTLRIFTEVSDVVSISPELGPTTFERRSETTVITRDSQMIVIGGLMADAVNYADTGVPYLKNIPIFGSLFRSESDRRRKRNLLILITPHIIRDQFDARDITIKDRREFQEISEEFKVEPNRSEFLNNPAVDRVSESENYDGQKPTTIKPPLHRKEDKKDERNTPTLPSQVNKKLPPLSLKVTPHIKSDSDIAPKNQSKNNQGSELASSSVVLNKTQKVGSYVMLELENEKSAASEGVPFKFLTSKGRPSYAAIFIPSESDIMALNFFKVGRRYSYTLNNKKIFFTALGVFGSPGEVSEIPEAYWYKLSPYEIIGLGKNPWKAEAN
jgi:hypothetical protein